jgi:predicted nicotinamide N-methyase
MVLALPGPLFPAINFRPQRAQDCLAPSTCGGKEAERSETHGKRFIVNGTPLYLQQKPHVSSSSHAVLTAASVWDCSLMLAKYVEKHAQHFRGKTVLELGSGQGVVGITAAMCGAGTVILTDVAPALPSIEHNIALNSVEARAVAAEVDWHHPKGSLVALPPADIILAADVVWVEELVAPFVNTLSLALQSARASTAQGESEKAYVLLCHKTRSHHTDKLLLQELASHGLALQEIPTHEQDSVWRSSELTLWRVV